MKPSIFLLLILALITVSPSSSSLHSLSSPSLLSNLSSDVPQLSSTNQDGTNAAPAPAAGFTNFSLVLQFSKSLCNFPAYNKKCDKKWKEDLPNRFTIHGLWPNFGTNPKPAPPSPRKNIELSKLLNERVLVNKLYDDWLDAYFVPSGHGTKEVERKTSVWGFWTHEWDYHGVFSQLSTVDYFRDTHALFEQLRDIYGRFEQLGLIVKGEINVTTASEVLTQALRVKPYMRCLFNSKGDQLLFEIQVTIRKGDLARLNHAQSQLKGHNCSGHMAGLRI
ncbi:hypothetical protein MKW92_040979 [Papaver armeniacum]|nr:hypothetical protein MKW92_040979 [Papaver armeniacum]